MPQFKPPTGGSDQSSLPAVMQQNGTLSGIGAGLAVSLPIGLIGLLIPPPFGTVIIGVGAALGFMLGANSAFNIKKIQTKFREENPELFTKAEQKGEVLDGTYEEVVPVKERALRIARGALSALDDGKLFQNKTIKTLVKELNEYISFMTDDVEENGIDDPTVMDFMITQVEQYKKSMLSYIKLRKRLLTNKEEETNNEIEALDAKIEKFLKGLLEYVKTVKQQMIETDAGNLKIEMRTMDSMIDSVTREAKRRMEQQIDRSN